MEVEEESSEEESSEEETEVSKHFVLFKLFSVLNQLHSKFFILIM